MHLPSSQSRGQTFARRMINLVGSEAAIELLLRIISSWTTVMHGLIDTLIPLNHGYCIVWTISRTYLIVFNWTFDLWIVAQQRTLIPFSNRCYVTLVANGRRAFVFSCLGSTYTTRRKESTKQTKAFWMGEHLEIVTNPKQALEAPPKVCLSGKILTFGPQIQTPNQTPRGNEKNVM